MKLKVSSNDFLKFYYLYPDSSKSFFFILIIFV
ncbi:MAG: hypothetical protein PARBA_01896 [Parabacteroides sp.]